MINRNEVTVLNQEHQMFAEGAHDYEPNELDVKKLLLSEGYESWNFDIFYDKMTGLYRWYCKIKDAT